MKNISLILPMSIFLMIGNTCHSQDTVFYDKNWKKTQKSNASYFRTIKPLDHDFLVTDFFIDGKIQMTGTYSSISEDTKDGSFKYYSPSGFVSSEGDFVKNKKEGEWKGYHENSSDLLFRENYKNDILEGIQYYYYPNGNLKRKDSVVGGDIKMGTCYTSAGNDTAYFPFKKLPHFVGGEAALINFLQTNIVYPPDAKFKDIKGTVYVQFFVEEDGSVSEVELARGVHRLLNAEALRVVKAMPRWIPGKIDGKPTRVKYMLPIYFKLV